MVRRKPWTVRIQYFDSSEGRIRTIERGFDKRSDAIDGRDSLIKVDKSHLKAIILLAIDSGVRRGEILKLRWQDIDFQSNQIFIDGTHTKTERKRSVPLTDREKVELYRLRELNEDRPFPFAEFKRSWATAKRIAEIENLHFIGIFTEPHNGRR